MNQLVASSGSFEGIEKLISEYFYSRIFQIIF